MNFPKSTEYQLLTLTEKQMKKAGVEAPRGFLALPLDPTRTAKILNNDGTLAKEITVAEAFKL